MSHTEELALDLTVRFSVAISDVSLTIDTPRMTSTLSLHQRVRLLLPTSYASCRLRLIYAGKVLPDSDSLWKSLNVSSLKATNVEHAEHDEDGKPDRKGKLPLRHTHQTPAAKLYVHCSIGNALTQLELEDEAIAAAASEEALRASAASGKDIVQDTDERSADQPAQPKSTTIAPRGFDRLLSTGFTASEVAHLRTQFLANLSFTHTPETMPTGAALLALEDRWLDSDSNSAGGGGGINGVDGSEAWATDDARALDDFILGNVVGFFWPVGALIWGFREEGVWTRQRQIAVFTGVLVNLAFGFARLTS